MLVALALYTSTAHAGIPPDSAERRASVRMQTSLTEDQRAKSGRDRRPREEPFTATPSTCSGPDSPCIVPSEYGIQLPVFVAGALALGMNEAAYLSEVVRSGLMSVDRGQREAAQVLGMSSAQVLLWVTLPQAARVMIPPMGNAFNAMLKTTSLLGFISYEELLRHANLVLDTVYRPFEIFAVITVYYLAMTTAWGLVQSRLERYFRVGGSAPVARRRPMPRLAEV